MVGRGEGSLNCRIAVCDKLVDWERHRWNGWMEICMVEQRWNDGGNDEQQKEMKIGWVEWNVSGSRRKRNGLCGSVLILVWKAKYCVHSLHSLHWELTFFSFCPMIHRRSICGPLLSRCGGVGWGCFGSCACIVSCESSISFLCCLNSCWVLTDDLTLTRRQTCRTPTDSSASWVVNSRHSSVGDSHSWVTEVGVDSSSSLLRTADG